MKQVRTFNAATAAVALVLALAGCSDQLGDRGGEEGAAPDKISDVDYVEVYRNADNFANVARICIRGIAFAATSSGARGEDSYAAPSLVRVPEWDPTRNCARPSARRPDCQGPRVTAVGLTDLGRYHVRQRSSPKRHRTPGKRPGSYPGAGSRLILMTKQRRQKMPREAWHS